MHSYASIAQLRLENKSTSSAEDETLLEYGRQISAAVDAYVASRWGDVCFIPRAGTWYYDLDAGRISRDGYTLLLDTSYAAISAVTDGSGAALTADTHYAAYPRGQSPITALFRIDGGSWWTSTGLPGAQIAVTGTRVYREYYAEAWESVTALTAPLTDSGTTLTVTTTTRLSAGMLIRIADEWCIVVSGSATSWVVRRGVRGSTAAEHLSGVAVEVFHPDPVIVRATARWAGLAFARRGAYEQTRFDGTASVQFPAGIPEEVVQLLRSGGWARVRPVLV